MSEQQSDPHADIHSEQGARREEHSGRSTRAVSKVRDLAWLEFAKPDLDRAEIFARAFGFTTAARTANELVLRGATDVAPCVVVHRGTGTRFLGPTFLAETADLVRLAAHHGTAVRPLPESLGGSYVELRDPSGLRVRVAADVRPLAPLDYRHRPLVITASNRLVPEAPRVNATQRPPRRPSPVERLGHVVLQSTTFVKTLDWYLDNLGMIVSDFLYYDGQRERGPVMAFVRCDQGSVPSDHHTLAMMLGPSNRYVHSAYQVADLDTLAAGGEYLLDLGYRRSWGVGRHVQGSQVFDYWRDPDGFLVEHFADGDMFDCTLEPGWAPMTTTGLAQWGPPATKDFLGTKPSLAALRELGAGFRTLREANEFDLERLRGLAQVGRS